MPIDRMGPTATELLRQNQQRTSRLLKGSRAIADYIGLSPRDVLALIKKGDLPGFQVGNKFVADPEAIERWLAAKSLAKLLSE